MFVFTYTFSLPWNRVFTECFAGIDERHNNRANQGVIIKRKNSASDLQQASLSPSARAAVLLHYSCA